MQYTFSPVARVSLPAAGLLLCLYLLTGRAAWYGGTILLLCAAAALERALPRGRPARLSRALTRHFYAVYDPLAGRWCVSERRPGRCARDCKEAVRALLKEQTELPAALFPGAYRALTHDTVLRRMEREERIRIERVQPAYTASLRAVYNSLTGGRCRRCRNRCPFGNARTSRRTFYAVSFTVE